MADSGRFSDKILGCIERHRSELAEQQKLTDGTMKELLEKRKRFAGVSRRIMETIIQPRMEELKRHFDNAVISECHGDTDFRCFLKFSHTARFPARVSLGISLLPGESDTGITVRYDLEILPILMEFKRDAEKSFPLDDADETIGLWVEDKIVEFVDTYLRLETHPLYQKANIVVDPVCGMQISAITAASRVELSGHTFYFCSEVCKETFQKGDNPPHREET